MPAARALSFSAQPIDQEFFAAHIFEEPLVPIGATTPADNAAFAQALVAFSQRSQPEDYSALIGFLGAHPQSPWRASLLTGLGIVYVHHGYFTRALDAWSTAWTLSKDSTNDVQRAMADRALSEQAKLRVNLGTTGALQQILKESQGRELTGSSKDRLRSANEMLWFMVAKPEHAFRCGPFSLDAIGRHKNPHQPYNPDLIDVDDNPVSAPTKDGMTLSQVQKVAQKVGMNYRMAKRPTGAALPVPAVVHWKSGHYSAAVAQDANGRYLLKDSNFGGDFWISQAALDEESSGYVLLSVDAPKTSGANTQAAQTAAALPDGWQDVQESEGTTVWGGCHSGTSDSGSTDHCSKKAGGDQSGCHGMATYSVHAMLVSLNIVDTPVGYAPPVGPSVYFNLSYSQREANQPANFNYMNFGSRWTCEWLAYVSDDPTNAAADANVYLRGGGTKRYSGYSAASGAYVAQRDDRSVLKRTSTGTSPVKYQRSFADGSTEFYETSDGSTSYPRKVFLTRISDSQGNNISLGYDASLRLKTISDPVNPPTTITYKSDTASVGGSANPDFYKVAKVTDPFGRFATFEYTNGELSKITDVIGLTSQFTYQGDFINQLTTPYGTTSFASTESGSTGSTISAVRTLEITDPYGAKERFEFHQDDSTLTSTIPMGDSAVPQGMSITNDYLAYRNTFYWTKKSMLDDPSHPYAKAHIYHWLHDDNLNQITSVLESEKAPLENRVWYLYPDQSPSRDGSTTVGSLAAPSAVGRVLDDGTTQLSRTEYNAIGNVTKAVGPALDTTSHQPVDGRTTLNDYDAATGMDLLMVRQQTGASSSVVFEKRVYDPSYPAHCPKQIIDASGQPTAFTYNAQGRVLTVTNAKNETTTYSYTRPGTSAGPADGYLYSVTGAVPGATTSFTYDAMGRPNTSMDSEGYQLTFTYDALDRLITTTYPDAAQTYTQNVYDRLDVEWTCDRLGRWTHSFHDALRRLVAIQDPLGRTTNYGYCLCGALTSLTDPAGNTTQWAQDLQGRQINKTYADTTQAQYAYEQKTSRLKTVTDAMSKVTNYTYAVDDNLVQTTYTGPGPVTPTVSLTYDTTYNRLTTMVDGTGTTTYGYGAYLSYSSYSTWPSGATTGISQLASEAKIGNAGMASYTVHYNYDELGRSISRDIDGPSNNQSMAAYDALGRVSSVANPLGTFGYDYPTPTSRQVTLAYFGSRTGMRTAYTYFPNSGDTRLQTINNLAASGTTISRFDYAYNAVGDITTWTQQTDNQPSQAYNLGYDAADQLTAAVLKDTSPSQTVLKTYVYGYDQAANRTSAQTDLTVTTATPNNLNQITRTSVGGFLQFTGSVNEPAVVTVGGNSAQVNGNQFIGYAKVFPGVNTITVAATGQDGQTTTNHYQVQIDSGVGQTLAYDSDGNLKNDGSGKTYEWDALNRLVAINYMATNTRTEFAYDGRGRCVQIVEKSGESITSGKAFVWCCNAVQPSEERDAVNNVAKRFFGQGEQIAGRCYVYTYDNLRNVRELLDSTQTVRARYSYDMYGERSINQVTSGSVESEFGYTGQYWHAPSGLYQALYRTYDPNFGRWLSRDPSGEASGINLYDYVENNPVKNSDPLGLWTFGVSINISGNLIPGWATGSIGIFIGNSKRCGFSRGVLWTGGGGAGYGVGASIGASAQLTNAHSVENLTGQSETDGGSFGLAAGAKLGPSVGGSYDHGGEGCSAYKGISLGAGLGVGTPEIHAGVTNSGRVHYFD